MNIKGIENIKAESQSNYIFEACVENINQCIKAEKNGAHRVELCADLSNGGTTPSYGIVKKAKEILNIPVFVIIRPRGGNFIYDRNEVQIMIEDIKILSTLNVDGFVIGLLKESKGDDGLLKSEVDWENIELLVDAVKSSQVNSELTFHMAFDSININADGDFEDGKDINYNEKDLSLKYETIDKLIELGFKRILTKGCNINAPAGLNNLKMYNEYSSGRIIIMPGGGVTLNNYKEVAEATGSKELHGTKIVGT